MTNYITMTNNMTMTYETVTPEYAQLLLNTCKGQNRNISLNHVQRIASDITAGNWDAKVGSAISIDSNGILRDGQHRLSAVVMAGKSIDVWVCRGVSETGMYDVTRARSTKDNIAILRRDLPSCYRNNTMISTLRNIIYNSDKSLTRYNGSRGSISPKSMVNFIDANRDVLDEFFIKMSTYKRAKVSIATVFTALFNAYYAGVPMDDITAFMNILCSGMGKSQKDFPIIAYRNYLLDADGGKHIAIKDEIGRCQYALHKWLTGSCAKSTRVPKNLIWDWPVHLIEVEEASA